MNITDAHVAGRSAALDALYEWKMRPQADRSTLFDLVKEAAARAVDAAAAIAAKQALREAAEAHASYDDTRPDYVGHDDRCDYGPPPCDCSKGRTAVWLNRRADELETR